MGTKQGAHRRKRRGMAKIEESVRDAAKAHIQKMADDTITKEGGGDKTWGDFGEAHSDVCKELMSSVMDYLCANDDLSGHKFFVKCTLCQHNGYAQCATKYWTPDGVDLSVNATN